MKQLGKDVICFYCYGCNKLELENFNGIRNCKGFYPAYKNWEEKYYKALKEKKNDKRKGF